MKFKLTPDMNFLELLDCTQLEYDQLVSSFNKTQNNWFIIRRKFPHWDGKISFFSTQTQRVPRGLWAELKKLSKKFEFSIQIEDAHKLINPTYDEKLFDTWINDFFANSSIKPRYYQIDSAKAILKYMKCTEEISTSAGKTLISYLIFRYLLDKGEIKKMLYVVPNISLVEQSEDKFYEYEEKCGHSEPEWKSLCVFSGNKRHKEEDINITFGTYQSLTKKPLECFKDFDVLFIDECHHAQNQSLKTISTKCYNAKYKFGMSGSLPIEDSCDSFTIQTYLGPTVYTLSSHQLIDEGNATPVNVIGIQMDYLSDSIKKELYDLRNVSADEKDGVKLLNLEKQIARDERKRLLYICDIISKSKKNSLVLFSDIKNSYGKDYYDWLRENTDKTVYYIDGNTDVENRDYYKAKMEAEENVIIVASVGTMGEGVDIKNLHTIYIIESFKSSIIIQQVLGRGMRLLPGKPKITVFDFVDDFKYNGTNKYQQKNYLLRHAAERERIYQEKKFPFKKFKVKL